MMGTYNHTISKLKAGRIPSRFVVIASAAHVERVNKGTPIDVSRLQVGAARTMRRAEGGAWACVDYVYQTTDELVDIMQRGSAAKSITWVVAHDLAYHLTVSDLWLQAVKGRLSIEGYHLQGRYCTAQIRIGSNLLHCVDSSNYLDTTWPRAREMLGLPIPDHIEDVDSDGLALDTARDEVEAVAALVQRLVELLSQSACGSWGWSLGALAWQSWRRGLMGESIHVHDKRDAITMERAAYTGGRTECRFIGQVKGRVHVVDYNSLYAHVMATDAMPTKLLSVSSETLASLTSKLSHGLLAVAEVKLNATQHDYPVVLWRGKGSPPSGTSPLPSYMRATTHWRRVNARGAYHTTLATPEIRRALDAGEIVSVQRVSWYSGGRPFERFAQHWYARRLAARAGGQAAEEAICKRILTVLCGKFGQHSNQWADCPGRTCPVPFGHWHEWNGEEFRIFRAIAGVVEVYSPSDPDEWKHAFPAISAHITSGARVLTDLAVEIAGPHDCYYYDTDCLHVSDWGLERLQDAGLLDNVELGKLKVKGTYDGATYRNRTDWEVGALVERIEAGSKGSSDDGNAGGPSPSGGNTLCAGGCYAQDKRQSSVHGGSPVNNLCGNAPDSWKSYVVGTAVRRNFYVGRVSPDGWVKPLVVNADGEPELQSLFGGVAGKRPSTPSKRRKRGHGNRRPAS